MELDPDAIEQRIQVAEKEARRTAAVALRMQAITHRSMMKLYEAAAREFDVQANRLDPSGARPPNVEPAGSVARVLASKPHETTGEREYAGVGNIPLSKAMRDFIESFHPRYRDSEFFVGEVNRAAEEGWPINAHTAHLIAGRVQGAEEQKRLATPTERSTDG